MWSIFYKEKVASNMSLEETWDTTEIAGDLVEQMAPNFMADNKTKKPF